MKATSKIQAERIAQAGVKKMDGEYFFRPFPMSQVAGHVVKADGTRYTVNAHASTCNCAFYNENKQYKVCKHTIFAQSEIEWEARTVAEYEARF